MPDKVYPYQNLFVICGDATINGGIWWPYGAAGSLDIDINGRDLDAMVKIAGGEVTAEAAADFLAGRAGDFSSLESWKIHFRTGDGRTVDLSGEF